MQSFIPSPYDGDQRCALPLCTKFPTPSSLLAQDLGIMLNAIILLAFQNNCMSCLKPFLCFFDSSFRISHLDPFECISTSCFYIIFTSRKCRAMDYVFYMMKSKDNNPFHFNSSLLYYFERVIQKGYQEMNKIICLLHSRKV